MNSLIGCGNSIEQNCSIHKKDILICGIVLILVGIVFIPSVGSDVESTGLINYVIRSADEQEIFTDPQGDVLTFDLTNIEDNLNKTDEKPNIDIKKLTYTHNDGSADATIILEVYGEIEDKGNLDDIDSLNSVVLYSISIETSNGVYDFSYVNKQCQFN